jgi:hypothetical protein
LIHDKGKNGSPQESDKVPFGVDLGLFRQ